MRKKFIAVLMISAMILTFAAPLSASAASSPALWSVTWARGYSSYNRVRLEWKQVANADGYRVYWAANGVRGNVVLKGRNTLKYTHVITDSRLLDRDITYVVYGVKLGTVNGKKNQVVKMSPHPCTIKASPIRLMTIRFTFAENRTLTSHEGTSTTKRFYEGDSYKARGYDQGRYVFPVGKLTYYVSRLSTYNAYIDDIDSDKTYWKRECEDFVNTIGITSNTDYLIWVNQYTQRLCIFKGYQGHWSMICGPWQVSTGKASTPTDTGKTRIYDKEYYGTPMYWNICQVFSIHGRLYSYGDLNWPKSNGCVRNTDDHALYIYNHCPIGTAVYIF